MPPITMNVDYMKKRSKSVRIFETSRTQKQLTFTPSRFRFPRYQHVALGVIHPESNKTIKKQNRSQSSVPNIGKYQSGDREYMEVVGTPCPTTNVLPDIIYTNKDRAQLPIHLIQPFFYIQQLFPKGRPVAETALEHPDVFIDFTTLPESKRNNKNIYNTDYIKILKQMTKTEREQFYTKSTQMTQQFSTIFKRMLKGLIQCGLFPQNYKLSQNTPKVQKLKIEAIGEHNNLIHRISPLKKPIIRIVKTNRRNHPKFVKEYDQLPINVQNMQKYFKLLKYPSEHINEDVAQLFDNAIIGDSPMNMLIQKNQQDEEPMLSFAAFLHNLQKFAKGKYKVANIFSFNAAKQRNVFVKFSLYPFLDEGWRVLKACLKELEQCEQFVLEQFPSEAYKQLISQRKQILIMKRIWAKHLQHTPLQYILLKFQEVKDVYVNTINYNSERIQIFSEFINNIFQEKQQQQIRLGQQEYQSTGITNEIPISMQEAADYMLQFGYTRSQADLILAMIQKTLKHYGLAKIPKKSKYQTIVQLQQDHQVHYNQIHDFLQQYTMKQSLEWGVFQEFIYDFHDFYESRLTLPEDSLKNVRKQWQCNMIGEWLVKRMQKQDKLIEELLGKSVQIVQLFAEGRLNEQSLTQVLDNTYRMSMHRFLSEEIQLKIKQILQEQITKQQKQGQSEIEWDSDLVAAISRYHKIASDLQNTNMSTNHAIQPQEIIHQSAAELIDEQVKPDRSNQPKKPKKQVTNAHDQIREPEIIATQHKHQVSRDSQTTSLSESDLDRKIRNASMLQNQILNNIGKFKFTMNIHKI